MERKVGHEMATRAYLYRAGGACLFDERAAGRSLVFSCDHDFEKGRQEGLK
jgi:hypothetical protein